MSFVDGSWTGSTSVFHALSLAFKFVTQCFLLFFFFNDTATTEIYTLSLHDALPISLLPGPCSTFGAGRRCDRSSSSSRSEEHTSELQSHVNLVCRLLLEKKKEKLAAASFCTTT